MSDKAQVDALGKRIGYGNMMSLVAECWKESTLKPGSLAVPGSVFAIGPCEAATVPCDCVFGQRDCDWCAGTGWLTKHVKEIKKMSNKEPECAVDLENVAEHIEEMFESKYGGPPRSRQIRSLIEIVAELFRDLESKVDFLVDKYQGPHE